MGIVSPIIDDPFVEDILATVSDGIVVVDTDGSIAFATPQITDVIGYTPDEVVNRSIELLAPTENAERPLFDVVRNRASETEGNPGRETDDVQLSHSTGRYVPVSLSVRETYSDDRRYFAVSLREVSDRLERERTIEECESRFRTTFEHASDPFLIVDPAADVIRACNPKSCELLGYDEAELRSRSPSDIYPRDEDAFRAFVESTLEDGESRTDGIRCRRADGELFSTAVSGTVLELDGRRHVLVRVCETADDRERDPRDTDELFRAIFENSNDAILIFDPEGDEFLEVNPRACDLLGYDETELLRRGPSDVHSHELDAFREFVTEVLEQGDGWTRELSCSTRDGGVVPAEISMARIEFDGEPRVLASIRDLTERRDRERKLDRYRTIVETVQDGIYTLDSRGRFTQVNDYIVERTGYTRDELVGSHASTVLDQTDLERVREVIGGLLRTDRTVGTCEVTVHRADGGTVPAELHIASLSDGEESFRGTVGVARDVSERKERERELEWYETMVETIGEGVYALDEEFRFTTVNQGMANLTGYPKAELTDMHLDALLVGEADDRTATEHVDRLSGDRPAVVDLESARAAREQLRRSDRDIMKVECLILSADDEVIPCEVRFSALSADEDFAGTAGVVMDISERLERRRRLREERDRLSALFENTTDPIVETAYEDGTMVIKEINAAFEETFEYGPADVIDRPVPDVLVPDETEESTTHERIVRRVLDGEKVEAEVERKTVCGAREFWLRAVPFTTVDDTLRAYGIYTDITDRKEYERRLEALNDASRELMSADTETEIADTAVSVVHEVLDRSLTALWRNDPESDEKLLRPLAASDGATALLDSDDRPDVFPPIPDGSDEMAAFRAGEPRLLEDYENRANPAHPELRIQQRLIVPLDGHGVLAVGATSDEEIDAGMRNLVTIVAQSTCAAFDRLDHEREIRRRSAAMAAAIDGMAVLDETGEYAHANQAHANIYGYDDPEELIGEQWRRLYDDDETERFEREILPAVREEGSWRGEAVGMRADGSRFPQEVSLAPLESGGLVCIVRDITDRKEYEERLEALNEVSQGLAEAETAAEVARTGLRAVERIFGFDIGCVRLFDTETNALEMAVMTDAAADLTDSRPAFDLDATLAGRAYRQNDLVVTDPEQEQDRTLELRSLHQSLGEYGVLTVFVPADEGIDTLERSLLKTLAASITAALGRANREQMLRTNERELRRQHEQLDTLYRITSLIQMVQDNLLEATTRQELERTVCERLVESDLYRSAWIAEVGVNADRVDGLVGAGVDDSYLDALDEIPLSMLGSGTVEEVIETKKTQVVQQYERRGFALEEDDEQHIEAIAAIPLVFGDRIYGVLVVNGVHEDVFSENAVAGFESLAKLIGFAILALTNRKILLSDTIVDLELQVADPSIFYLSVTDELDCQCRFERSVPVEEGNVLEYHRIEGADQERVLDRAADADHIADARIAANRDDGFVLQTITDRSLSQVALEAGATMQSAIMVDGEARVTLEAPRSADLREIIDALDSVFADTELVAKREHEQEVRSSTTYRERVDERLTEKQRSALEAAYASGYYDWPREITAEELAESMGVSSSTLHQHLRNAVRSLAAALFDEQQV
ncbi:PAS domain S-box protein [Natrinema salsiterrestre]|uniref:PAS domain S-box protein n=1 Tax=Natrinema salsiterrestre TaxID=2950540 RepID=A0A9Q4L6P2_9EURY|nr:PAS domain S-box protein [Natrinema salsiterrestre]MDF9746930.1 PAS domain S-box protein [Natrinema salsiterrestre]